MRNSPIRHASQELETGWEIEIVRVKWLGGTWFHLSLGAEDYIWRLMSVISQGWNKLSLNPAYLTTNSTLRQLGWAIPHSCETISSDVVVKTAPCPPQSRVYNCVANIRTIMTCASILSSPPSPAPPITKSLSKTDPNGCLPPSLPAGCHCMQRKIFEVRKKYEVGKNMWILLHLLV